MAIMPKGYPKNPELARQRRSESHKKLLRSKSWYINVRKMLIKRNKDPKHIKKVKKSLIGHGFSEETLQKMRRNHADFNGNKNPNWKGEKVGVIGIHIWLRKFKKTRICTFCGLNKQGLFGTDWALIKGKEYERKRENFMELCRKCHINYDRRKG